VSRRPRIWSPNAFAGCARQQTRQSGSLWCVRLEANWRGSAGGPETKIWAPVARRGRFVEGFLSRAVDDDGGQSDNTWASAPGCWRCVGDTGNGNIEPLGWKAGGSNRVRVGGGGSSSSSASCTSELERCSVFVGLDTSALELSFVP
jgi:hypothetical protein